MKNEKVKTQVMHFVQYLRRLRRKRQEPHLLAFYFYPINCERSELN
jgi:hypothetical protein